MLPGEHALLTQETTASKVCSLHGRADQKGGAIRESARLPGQDGAFGGSRKVIETKRAPGPARRRDENGRGLLDLSGAQGPRMATGVTARMVHDALRILLSHEKR